MKSRPRVLTQERLRKILKYSLVMAHAEMTLARPNRRKFRSRIPPQSLIQ